VVEEKENAGFEAVSFWVLTGACEKRPPLVGWPGVCAGCDAGVCDVEGVLPKRFGVALPAADWGPKSPPDCCGAVPLAGLENKLFCAGGGAPADDSGALKAPKENVLGAVDGADDAGVVPNRPPPDEVAGVLLEEAAGAAELPPKLKADGLDVLAEAV
jgi:hypothetical protein